jgi:hypothetical protein
MDPMRSHTRGELEGSSVASDYDPLEDSRVPSPWPWLALLLVVPRGLLFLGRRLLHR